MFDTIIKLLENASTATSAELMAALQENKNALVKVDAQIETLERERRDALLKLADKDIEALDRKIAGLHRQVDRHHAATARLQPLIESALKREQQDRVEECAKKARAKQKELLHVLVEMDSLAIRLAEVLDRMTEGDREIDRANDLVMKHGREDLRVQKPLGMLMKLVGTDSPLGLPYYVDWELNGYFPVRYRPEFMLGRAKELID